MWVDPKFSDLKLKIYISAVNLPRELLYIKTLMPVNNNLIKQSCTSTHLYYDDKTNLNRTVSSGTNIYIMTGSADPGAFFRTIWYVRENCQRWAGQRIKGNRLQRVLQTEECVQAITINRMKHLRNEIVPYRNYNVYIVVVTYVTTSMKWR